MPNPSDFAIVDASGNILNIIYATPDFGSDLPLGQFLAASPASDGSIAQIGGTYDGQSFGVPPN